MKDGKYTRSEVEFAQRQAAGGSLTGDITQLPGVDASTLYFWRMTFAHQGVSELRHLRQLERDENRRRRVVANIALDSRPLVQPQRRRAMA